MSDNLAQALKALSHHAYCILGRGEAVTELLEILEKKHGLSASANPDFSESSFSTFTIDEARKLKADAETRPIGKTGKRVFVLQIDTITSEAQNALLKLLEEPPQSSMFFLIVPEIRILLPTVRSRLRIISGDNGSVSNGDDLEEAEKFVKMSVAKRLEYVKDLVDDIAKEKKTKRDAILLLDGVMNLIHSKSVSADNRVGALKDRMKALEAVSLAKEYAGDRAPSLKMLLEYVALNL